MKAIICFLFHKTIYKEYYFTDVVAGEPVYQFLCSCGKSYMATSRWSGFRIYIKPNFFPKVKEETK